MRRRFLPVALLLGAAAVLLWPAAAAPPVREPAMTSNGTRGRSLPPRAEPAPAVDADAPPAAVEHVAAARPGRRIPFLDAAPRPGPLARIARELLAEHRGRLGLDAMPGILRTKREFESLTGWHLRLEQVVDGVPVYASEVGSHVTADGRPLLLAADVYPLEGVTTTPGIDAAAARTGAVAFLRDGDEATAVQILDTRLVLLPEGVGGHLAWMVDAAGPDEELRVFVDAVNGEPLRIRNLRVADEGEARIYDPNPVYTLRTGSIFDDFDRDSITFTNVRKLVTLRRLDGSGYLRGAWCDTRVTTFPAFAEDLDWTGVTRSDPDFEQLMAYYHIDFVQQRLQDLGIDNANAEPQHVDAHALLQDRSFYSLTADRILLGDGGVDDGEDADVIVHEYGHALQHDQVPNYGEQPEGDAMGEGFSDFLAAAFHTGAAPSYDPLVASWDATAYSKASPPYLRRVDKNKRYPLDYVDLSHEDGEIWSRFLWDVLGAIGADEALRVIVESHFLLTPNAEFVDGADAVLLANMALREGRDDATLRSLLDNRGLPYLVDPAPPPDEDPYEDNDTLATAADMTPGSYEQMRLDDEDWFRIDVPAYSRVLVSLRSDPKAANVDLDLRDAAGLLSAASATLRATERVEVSAGPVARVAYVRVHHTSKTSDPVGYDLTIVLTELELLPLKTTRLLRLEPGTRLVFRVPVTQQKVDLERRLRVASRRHRRNGALPDLRLLTPSGGVAHEFGTELGTRNAVALVDATEPGYWIVEIVARPDTTGRVRLRARHRR